jgi:hypothetical protein
MKKHMPPPRGPLKKTVLADFVDLAKTVVEQVEVLTKTCGPTRAYIAVIATIGLAFLTEIASKLVRLAPFMLVLYLPELPMRLLAKAVMLM